MDYPKSVPSVGLVNGKFVDENPVTGQVGSLISSDWGNAVTDELLNVIRAGGKEPAEAEHDQLLAAIKAIVRDSIPPEKIRTTLAEYGITDAYTKSVTYTKAEIEALLKNMSALPVGAMVPFPKGTVPPGFLEVDGSVQSAATYPDLAAYLGTTFNTGGEGAGNFRLPESRGEFLRGWDHGRGVDAGRGLGSWQADEFKSHTHRVQYGANPGNGLGSPGYVSANLLSSVGLEATGGAETRPRNLAVMWCIKAWSAPVNQANINIAALASLASQATEINQGTAKVATQAQMNSGTDDAVIATPKKLRFGFSMSLASNGYITFPSWLGGLVIQWGQVASSYSGVITFPIPFPNNIFSIVGTPYASGSGGYNLNYGVSPSLTSVAYGLSVATAHRWIAFGN
ncbi:tail fiber protein [Pseudomonas danubii]|uniref:phage tail protein n=1 Tax=Pseudomonas danubii TaxID=2497146 RepID=UPI003857652C